MTSERRNQQRSSLKLKARISCRHAKDSSTVIETVTANISSWGAFLQTSHDFALASKIRIELKITLESIQKLKFILPAELLKKLSKSQQAWICCNGIVIRKEPGGIGVIFDTDYQISPTESI